MFYKRVSLFFYKYPVAILFICWSISVAVRIPNLNRPLSKHHELNPALVLINAEEWNRKTPRFYHYVPVNSYHFPGDNIDFDIIKSGGYLVNDSFGTLWYIMPYLFFQLLHLPPSPLMLQFFNLLLQLITVLLIYKIAFQLFYTEENTASKALSKALTTAVIYLFSPAPLWFHGNGYVHEVAVLPFILGACLVYFTIAKNEKTSFAKHILFLILIVGGICCDWLMCFVAAAIFIISLWLRMKTGKAKHAACMITATAAVFIALVVTAIQFSSFMGLKIYSESLLSRFILRGIAGDVKPAGVLSSAGLPVYYLTGYGIIIPFLLYCFLFLPQFRKRLTQNKKLAPFLLIATIICLTHHVIFWGFSNIHDYAVLKSGLILSLLAVVAVFSFAGKEQKLIALMLVVVVNTSVYYFINRPGATGINGQSYTYFKSLGEKIKAVATPDDYIFIDTPEMSLLLTYYSKRYYRNVKDIGEANEIFRTLPGKDALFIHTKDFTFINSAKLKK